MPTADYSSWLQNHQSESLQKAKNMGWPETRDEQWRYSSPQVFLKAYNEYVGVLPAEREFSVGADITEFSEGADHTLYFYNNQLLKLSNPIVNESLIVAAGANVFSKDDDKKYLFSNPGSNLKGLGEINSAHFQNPIFIKVGRKDKPVRLSLVYIYGNMLGAEIQKPFSVYPKTVVRLLQGTQAEIFEVHLAANNILFSVNNRTQYIIEENAHAEVTQTAWLGDEAIFVSDVQAQVERNSNLNYFNILFGSRQIRQENNFSLNGSGAKLGLYQMTRSNNNHILDTNTAIDHACGYTESDQIVKNIVFGKSKVSFSGRLKIALDAQKSEASQYCHNLLLHPEAEANTKPQLEVLADDVKAAHGATVGQLNADELFYLQSRAVDKSQAEKLLSEGFQREIIDKINSTFLRKKMVTLLNGDKP